MKKFILFLLSLSFVFAGAFAGARWIRQHRVVENRLSFAEKKAPAVSFRPNPFPLQNRSFAVVILGKNNGASVEKTLSSVFSQNYDNYRVLYIDDASKDGSFELARDLIYESGHLMKVTLVHNEESLGALANLKRAVETCKDTEILVVVEGEDWLAHEWVLQRLNAYYADPDLWVTYGQYLEYPTYRPGECKEVAGREVRREPFAASHLKTFYAGLFKKIRESDFVYQGKFFRQNGEMAYMFPLLEMAASHSQFIPEILYIANAPAHAREDREALTRSEKLIRSLPSYSPLAKLQLTVSDEVP